MWEPSRFQYAKNYQTLDKDLHITGVWPTYNVYATPKLSKKNLFVFWRQHFTIATYLHQMQLAGQRLV